MRAPPDKALELPANSFAQSGFGSILAAGGVAFQGPLSAAGGCSAPVDRAADIEMLRELIGLIAFASVASAEGVARVPCTSFDHLELTYEIEVLHVDATVPRGGPVAFSIRLPGSSIREITMGRVTVESDIYPSIRLFLAPAAIEQVLAVRRAADAFIDRERLTAEFRNFLYRVDSRLLSWGQQTALIGFGLSLSNGESFLETLVADPVEPGTAWVEQELLCPP